MCYWRVVESLAAGHAEVGHLLVEVVVLLIARYGMLLERADQVYQHVVVYLCAIAESQSLCRMNDAFPKVHEVYIVEFGVFDLLVDWPKNARRRFLCVDLLVEEFLDQRVVSAVLLWAEPSSYLRDLVDLFRLGFDRRKDFFDLLVLFLEKSIRYEHMKSW